MNGTVLRPRAGQDVQPSAAMPSSPQVDSKIVTHRRWKELLKAARSSRASWVDGTGHFVSNDLSNSHTSLSLLSEASQAAIETASSHLNQFHQSLKELRRRIDFCRDSEMESSPEHTFDPSLSSSSDFLNDNVALNSMHSVTSRTVTQEIWNRKDDLDSLERSLPVSDTSLLLQSSAEWMNSKPDQAELVFLLAFRQLIHTLKQAPLAEIVHQIQSFVHTFHQWNLSSMLSSSVTKELPGNRLHAFIRRLYQQLVPFLSHASSTSNQDTTDRLVDQHGSFHERRPDTSLLYDTLETFVLEKVYDKALTPSNRAQCQDEQLRERIQSLSFVQFRHLDLPDPEWSEAWEELALELRQISSLPSARRKLDCILNVCRRLTHLLHEQSEAGDPTSADDLLPALIYVLLRSNPAHLQRNVAFIQEYRSRGLLVGESGYFFTHFASSVAFLEQVDGELLTITPQEFEDGLERSRKKLMDDIADNTRDGQAESASSGRQETYRNEGKEPVLPDVLAIRQRRIEASRRR